MKKRIPIVGNLGGAVFSIALAWACLAMPFGTALAQAVAGDAIVVDVADGVRRVRVQIKDAASGAWQNFAMAHVDGRAGNAIQVFDPRSGSLQALDSGAALYSALTWRKESADLAALRSLKQDGYEGESYTALAWKNLGEKRSIHVDAPQRIVPSRAPQWSEDGSTVYVGIAEWPRKIEAKKKARKKTW